MAETLSGKVVIITGGGGGMGSAMTLGLIAEGADIATGVRLEKGQAIFPDENGTGVRIETGE